MRPSKVEFEIGKTKHGNPVRLVRQQDGTWSIVLGPADQRDGTRSVDGLTYEQLNAIGEAIDSISVSV